MQQRLPLLAPAGEVATLAVLAELRNVSPHRFPPLDLALIIKATSSHKVPAIPLKPTPRIVGVNPPFPAPDLKWLRCVHTEVIKLRIMAFVTKLRPRKPTIRIFRFTIGHILTAKYPQLEHLFWREFWLKI